MCFHRLCPDNECLGADRPLGDEEHYALCEVSQGRVRAQWFVPRGGTPRITFKPTGDTAAGPRRAVSTVSKLIERGLVRALQSSTGHIDISLRPRGIELLCNPRVRKEKL